MKQQRIFRNYYQCDGCPDLDGIGVNEWTDEMLVKGPSWCPCCERECEPYYSETLFEPQTEDAE